MDDGIFCNRICTQSVPNLFQIFFEGFLLLCQFVLQSLCFSYSVNICYQLRIHDKLCQRHKESQVCQQYKRHLDRNYKLSLNSFKTIVKSGNCACIHTSLKQQQWRKQCHPQTVNANASNKLLIEDMRFDTLKSTSQISVQKKERISENGYLLTQFSWQFWH